MRQTDSAMRMLISAYKAVLANCYIKETLAGSEMESRAMIKDR